MIMNWRIVSSVCAVLVLWQWLASGALWAEKTPEVTKSLVSQSQFDGDLLTPGAWHGWEKGFRRQGELFVCENGPSDTPQRGAVQVVTLNQTRPEPIVAVAWSKAEDVSGSPDNDYSLYLDLTYTDGTTLWGQTAAFDTGTHDWQRRQVIVMPQKPIRSVAMYMLLRKHHGKAWFRDPRLGPISGSGTVCLFDGIPVIAKGAPREGFHVRDVAADSDFLRLEGQALGLKLQCTTTERGGATWFDVTLSDTLGKDRAVTLVYAVPVEAAGLRWLQDARHSKTIASPHEYVHTSQFWAGSNGRLSFYPLGAVADVSRGTALAIDMAQPAFFRIGYNAGTEELFLAYDLGLAPEKPQARLRFCRYGFEPAWGFRAALERLYALFPDQFRCRTPHQGLWMPFAKISQVKGWEDFGFRYKEGRQ